ncbi:uncharacterized protein LOC127532770 isoform X2 [Acanthochromis polyacanthus]|uniref:uncharacterized protein LOC127532770 isoform X2 n=1 Tax=Acanthochromis polyacanthus TaxID=80966 RepID=UPI00223400C6|nr:uncharacterized protein LOC127532770 isoform X2 [Acanthochromis polyacanthus]
MLGVYSCLFLMSLVSFQHLFSFVDIFLLLFFRISFSYCSLRCSRTFRLQELLSVYVGILRRFMMAVAASVLLVAYIRYTDPLQESLRLLQQLQDTQSSLQEALQRAESLCQKQKSEDRRLQVKVSQSRKVRSYMYTCCSSLIGQTSHMLSRNQSFTGEWRNEEEKKRRRSLHPQTALTCLTQVPAWSSAEPLSPLLWSTVSWWRNPGWV